MPRLKMMAIVGTILAFVLTLLGGGIAAAGGGPNPALYEVGALNGKGYVNYRYLAKKFPHPTGVMPYGVKFYGPDRNGVVSFWSNEVWSTVEIEKLEGVASRDWKVSVRHLEGESLWVVADYQVEVCGVEIPAYFGDGADGLKPANVPAWPCDKSQAPPPISSSDGPGTSSPSKTKKLKGSVTSLRVYRGSRIFYRGDAPYRGTVVRGKASPAKKVKSIKVTIRRGGKAMTRQRTAKGSSRWVARFPRVMKPGRYVVVARVKSIDGKVTIVKRKFRVR